MVIFIDLLLIAIEIRERVRIHLEILYINAATLLNKFKNVPIKEIESRS